MSQPLKTRMLSGAAWTAAARIAIRVLGVAATLIVARFVPQAELGTYGVIVILDVGVVALTSIGFGSALVQMPEDPAEFAHTAWTGDAFRALLAYLFEFTIAPWWCGFFHVPEATNVLRVYALGQLILGLHSQSTALLTRELKFARLVWIYAAESFVFSTLAIAGAVMTRSYLALVGASLAAYVARVSVSYLIHPYRPRIQFERVKAARMFRFVRWIMAYSVADFALEMTDNAVTGRLIGTVPLAHYRMAYQMAMEGPGLLQWIVGRVAFPAIAQVQSSATLVRKNTLAILAFTASTVAPGCVALAALAPRVVEVLLGPRWLPAAIPLRVLAMAAVGRALIDVAPPILRGVGKTRVDFLLKLFHVVVMCSLLVPFGLRWGLTGIAAAVAVAAAIALPVAAFVVGRVLDIPLLSFARATVPPFVATAIASLAFFIHGTVGLDVVAGVVFTVGYVAVSWIFVKVWPDAGVGAVRALGAGDETT